MRKFYIVKKAPTRDSNNKPVVTGDTNIAYSNFDAAKERAEEVVRRSRHPYVVMEAVACFDVAEVVEVEIED
jgi:hypothetical protein